MNIRTFYENGIRLFVVILLISSVCSNPADTFAQDTATEEKVGQGNNQFTFDLYAKVKTRNGNLFLSPFSVSTALAMAYAGARGETASQMADVLHFTQGREELNPAFSKLIQGLTANPWKDGFELSIANALWGQQGYDFYKEFVDITKEYYEAGFKEVDFKSASAREEARLTINGWIEKKTKDKIKDLIRPGMLNDLTRLVLTNAIYFKGKWVSPFKKNRTYKERFTLASGEEIKVPTMTQTETFMYAEDDIAEVLEMPYVGGRLSMVVLLPKKIDGIKDMEESLGLKDLNDRLSKLYMRELYVLIPKFKMTAEFELSGVLASLGMTDAFNIKKADFSAMAPDPMGLYISSVIHKAFADVDEEGTEATAATAVVMTRTAQFPPKPKPVFRADHPFVFIIRDIRSGSILFIGRIMDPRDASVAEKK